MADEIQTLPKPRSGFGLNIASGLMNMGSGIIGSVIQNKSNRELAKYSYGQELAQWNRANAYNTPKAQMERLQQAGLNPNMVYGTGSVAGNTAQTGSPSYKTPQMTMSIPSPNPAGMLSQYQDMRMRSAQIDNVAADTAAKKQATINAGISELLMNNNLSIGRATHDYQIEKAGWNAYKAHYDANRSYNAQEIPLYQADALKTRNSILGQLLGAQLELTKANLGNIISRTTGQQYQNESINALNKTKIFGGMSQPIIQFLKMMMGK